MLLEFRVSNYKSFKDEMVFSLVPESQQKGLSYSILQETIGKKKYKALCSAVIYGPNASGKTNVIGAMDTFKSIVLRGHIHDFPRPNYPNAAAGLLELIPNNSFHTPEPVAFGIKFIINNILIEYSFSADLGKFLDVRYHRRILSETLNINGSVIFKRENGLQFGNLKNISDYMVNGFDQNAESAVTLVSNNLNDEELFLMNGFKIIFSSKIVSLIADWLDNKFMTVYRADAAIPKPVEVKKGSILVEKTINEAAACFGINSNALGYFTKDEGRDATLCSVFDNGAKPKLLVPAELFESYGTIRFVNMFPLVAEVLVNGGILIADEFDASIHPMALMNIINIFHNDEINVNHAQLVFNTHNPIFLNANLYRRDEIKFVDRDDESHCSSLYSLADFKSSSRNDYMKNYFIDRYGAIKDIDFTPVFEDLLTPKDEG